MNMQTRRNSWIVTSPGSSGSEFTLFCFPYAGGGASIFSRWAPHFPREICICPVHLPGREGRINQSPFRSMAALADAATEALYPYLNGRYGFFGHSMGAVLGFEIARRIFRGGSRGPELLIVSGSRAPQTKRRERQRYALPDQEFLEELRALNGTPEAVLRDPELVQMLLPLLRADFEVHDSYRYEEQKPLNCPIHAFRGEGDPEVTVDDTRGWSIHTSAQFSLRDLPGNHFTMLDPKPVAAVLVGHLRKRAFVAG